MEITQVLSISFTSLESNAIIQERCDPIECFSMFSAIDSIMILSFCHQVSRYSSGPAIWSDTDFRKDELNSSTGTVRYVLAACK